MLERLFGSKTREKLLKLFLTNPDSYFFVREISRKLGLHINSVRRELDNLSHLKLIKQIKLSGLSDLKRKEKKKYYQVNKNFVLYPELKDLFIKSQLLLRNSLVKEIQKIGQIYLLILTGFFTHIPQVNTDILIIGRVNHRHLKKIVKKFEKQLDREIYYTVMTKEEFKYRRDLTDRFLFDILENRKVVLVNKLKLI